MIPEELRKIADLVGGEKVPHHTSPRRLIEIYGWQRRGRWINSQIRAHLRSLGLTTQPDFETSYIDGPIAVTRIPESSKDNQKEEPSQSEADIEYVTGGSVSDPVARIRVLQAANRVPVSVKRDDQVTTAMTLMLVNDFSQLPVMPSEREVNGMVSWRSIGRARALGRPCEYVRECMEDTVEIWSDAPLLEAISLVAKHETVLVRERDKRIVGLVTTSDLSLEFKNLAEPFLLIGEIENHLRRLIDGRFSREAIDASKNDADIEREISDVADLTFGEYIRLLEKPENWNVLSLDLDRRSFCAELNRVRRIRNDVMHFNPDRILDADLETLRDMVKFLQHF